MVDIMLKFRTDMVFEGRRLMLLEDAHYEQSGCTPWNDDGEGGYCAKAVADDGEHVIVYWELSNAEEAQLEDEMCDWDNPICVVHDVYFDFGLGEYEEIEF